MTKKYSSVLVSMRSSCPAWETGSPALPEPFPAMAFDFKLRPVRARKVGTRDQPDHTTLLDDRQVPIAPVFHHLQPRERKVIRSDGIRVDRHDIGQGDCTGI